MHTALRSVPRLLVLLVVVALPASALAQQTAPPSSSSSSHEGIGIGAKVGPLFSTLAQPDVTGSNAFANRTGIIGGLFIGGNRPGIVGVGVDILYARKGAKDPDSSDTLDLDYLDVPVYARINAGSSSTSGVSGYGVVGVDLNFLLKAKASGSTTDLTSSFERADYGLALGFGVEITRFVVEGRFTRGLGNIAKETGAAVTKTQTFAIMFGVRFN